jgi:hypothetical protein
VACQGHDPQPKPDQTASMPLNPFHRFWSTPVLICLGHTRAWAEIPLPQCVWDGVLKPNSRNR